jgi:hypothetical protein
VTGASDVEREEKTRRSPLRKLLSLPVLAATTALTAIVSWVVPRMLEGSQPAVGVVVQDNPASFGTSSIVAVFPRASDITGNPGQGCSTFHPWARRLGAVDVGETRVRVLAQGRRDVPIVISGLRAHVIERGPPQSGTAVVCPSAGVLQNRLITIDLDTPVPVARRAGPSPDFGFTLARGETEVFDITATTSRSNVSWSMTLDLLVDGAPKEVELLPPDRSPFRTTARLDDRAYFWDYEGAWGVPGEPAEGQLRPTIPVGAPLPPL